MKVFSVIAKILAVLSAVIGTVYVLATYGDKIVAWCKDVMARLSECTFCDEDDDEVEVEIEIDEEPEVVELAEEVAVEEVEAEEVVEEAAEAADTVVADEADFEA